MEPGEKILPFSGQLHQSRAERKPCKEEKELLHGGEE